MQLLRPGVDFQDPEVGLSFSVCDWRYPKSSIYKPLFPVFAVPVPFAFSKVF